MTDPVKWSILLVAAYGVGSIPFALIIGRARGIDIRLHGSGNVGASNVGRTLGRKYGMLCFALDVCKGLGPTVVAGVWCGLFAADMRDVEKDITQTQMLLWIGVAFAAIVGHTNSIFLGFKGGKGVATGFGSLLGIYPHLTWPILGALVVWLAAVKLWRMISVASMLAALSLPLWYLLSIASTTGGSAGGFVGRASDRWPFLLVTALLALLVLWKHRSNIARIRAGTETRVGEPAPGEKK
ncbi:MAG: glycerol-3-phosphate 1-O-acyltransferase PlsY [Phycisphaerales bacterium]|nr:glycerol-3-phosphate 1-O-acyltransferase PlsY [Phycisphaerales bacterium]